MSDAETSKLYVGVLVKNTRNTAASVTIKKLATCAGQTSTVNASSRMLAAYFNNFQNTSISIPAGEAKWIAYNSGSKNGDIITGRVQFITTSSKLTCKIAIAPKSVGATKAYTYPIITGVSTEHGHPTSSIFASNIRIADASSAKQFYLNAYNDFEGTNEYEKRIAGIGYEYLSGNYGVIYRLTGLGGKTLRLKANSSQTSEFYFVYKFGSENWQVKHFSPSSNTGNTLIVPANTDFYYVLSGGNFGNMQVDVL